MKWPTHLFSYSKTRQRKRLSLEAWANNSHWPAVSLASTGQPWLWIGSVPVEQGLQLQHVSAYKALKRLDLVDHWVPLLELDAIGMIHEDKDILRHWAHIEHPVFWQTLAKLFTMPLQAVPYPAREHGWDGADLFRVNTYWSVALDEAGKCGNVLPFEVAPAQALARYVRSEEAHHPRVALWLYSKGLRTMDQLHAHVDTTYNIGGDHFGTLSHERPVSLEYVVDWCEVLLRDFNLGFAQKVGVAGQALMAFGHAAWKEHLEPVFRPYIHGIDMQLLYLVCHAIPNDEVDMHATLDRTVWLATQHPGTAFDSKRVDLYRRGHAWPNTGLGVLLEYMTPQTRVDLYFLARKVREGEQGIAPSNMLDLPALS